MTAERPIRQQAAASEDAGLASLAHAGSLLERTAHGAAWVIGWRLATRGLGVINTLILVRLLVPADFGLVSLAYGFVGSIDALCSVGVEQAIIRDDHPDRDLYDTGFTINLLRAIGMGLLLMLGAGAIATVLGDRRLDAIVLAFGAMTALTGLTNIGVVDFQRYIAFDKEFLLRIVPRMLSMVVAFSTAMIWRSYWALVAGIMTDTLLVVAFGYFMHPYRPRLTLRAWRRLFGFSLWTWVIGLISTLRNQAPILIVGRLAGAAPVGFLNLGNELANLPVTELVSPICRACFSTFSVSRRDDKVRGEDFLRILGAMALLTLPAGVGISMLADPLVKIAFGTEWLKAVPVVEILGVAVTMTLFGQISGTLFFAHAWMRSMVKINLTTTLACILLLAFLVPRFNVLGAAIAIAVTDAVAWAIYFVATVRKLDIRIHEIFAQFWRSLLATVIMAAALSRLGMAWTVYHGTQSAIAIHFVEAVGLGAAIYFAVLGGTWLASGMPAGAESDALSLVGRCAARLPLRRSRT